jgi:predicted N-acetyltransferase YhbS
MDVTIVTVSRGRGQVVGYVIFSHVTLDGPSSFDFEPARRYDITSPFLSIPDDAFMVKPLAGYGELFRGRVVYPPAFAVT